MFAMFKNFINSQLSKPMFCPRTVVHSDKQKLSNFRIDFFYYGVRSPSAIKLFLLPFSSHCSMQTISFSDSGYVIKPPQRTKLRSSLSSAFHRVP